MTSSTTPGDEFLGLKGANKLSQKREFRSRDYVCVHRIGGSLNEVSFHYQDRMIKFSWRETDFSDIKAVGIKRSGSLGGLASDPHGVRRIFSASHPEWRKALSAIDLPEFLTWLDSS